MAKHLKEGSSGPSIRPHQTPMLYSNIRQKASSDNKKRCPCVKMAAGPLVLCSLLDHDHLWATCCDKHSIQQKLLRYLCDPIFHITHTCAVPRAIWCDMTGVPVHSFCGVRGEILGSWQGNLQRKHWLKYNWARKIIDRFRISVQRWIILLKNSSNINISSSKGWKFRRNLWWHGYVMIWRRLRQAGNWAT